MEGGRCGGECRWRRRFSAVESDFGSALCGSCLPLRLRTIRMWLEFAEGVVPGYGHGYGGRSFKIPGTAVYTGPSMPRLPTATLPSHNSATTQYHGRTTATSEASTGPVQLWYANPIYVLSLRFLKNTFKIYIQFFKTN